MLLGAGGVVDGDVGDAAVPAQQVGALPVDVHDRQELVVLEGVEAPPLLGDPRLGGLAVLDHHAAESVGVLEKRPGQFEARLLFVRSSFFFRFVIRLPELGVLVGTAAFVVLPVLPSPLVIELPLCLLLADVLSVPLPLVASRSGPFVWVLPSVRVVSVSVSVTASLPPVFLL